MSVKALESSVAKRAPSGVAITDRAPRSSSGMLNISSRLLMCRLIAPWVTDNSSAAAVMLERRTVASSARNAFRDGRFAPKALLHHRSCELFAQCIGCWPHLASRAIPPCRMILVGAQLQSLGTRSSSELVQVASFQKECRQKRILAAGRSQEGGKQSRTYQ